MARKGDVEVNGGDNSSAEPFARRIIELEEQRRALAEDIKVVYGEAKEAEVLVKPIKLAVRRYFEPESVRVAREETEEAAAEIIRALGGFAYTPLGHAALDRLVAEN